MMGTNYYAKIHLGKSSFDQEPHGTFYWATNPAHINWRHSELVITDEYGTPVDVDEFLAKRSDQRNDRDSIGEEFS